MGVINLNKIIEDFNLKKPKLAVQLFPKNKHPSHALMRVCNGETQLDAVQISKLATILGKDISELFQTTEWKQGITEEDNVIRFEKKNYVAELNIDTMVTKVYANGSLFHEIILSKNSIALSDFINSLEDIINRKTE